MELEEDYGVNLYSTFYRNYDPQLGRFGGVDVLSEKSIEINPYQFGINNPISFNDPWGDLFAYMDHNGNKWHAVDPLYGTAGGGILFNRDNGFDGFGDIDLYGGGGGGSGPGPSHITSFSYGMQNSREGIYIHYEYAYSPAHGNTLAGINLGLRFVPFNNSWGSNGENINHVNDGLGGLGAGLGNSSASFRLTNGLYNGSEFSFKSYSSGWGGGSRARITTYEVAGFGKGLARGSIFASVALGVFDVYEGYEADGKTYGANAQLATGRAVGGIAGGAVGGEIGAWVGGVVVGLFTGGTGTVPGAVVGGIIGGYIGGLFGSDAGKNVVKGFHH